MHNRELFPAYEMGAFRPPRWFHAHGLGRYKPLVTMLRASWRYWAQAELDGLSNLSPIIVIFNLPPAAIKEKVGGHVWHEFRTATQKANVNRMVLRLLGDWSLEEAMCWPTHERRHAKNMIRDSNKSTLLIACRHTRKGERLMDYYGIARDFERMGGVIDPNWGRKRLKREHDALAIQRALDRCNPDPWAKAWFKDIDGYTFTLLKSEPELAVEGATQRHCCKSYARACRAGREVVFSIMGRERATMSWNAQRKHLQVKAFANGDVMPETVTAAKRCLTAYFTDQRRADG